MFKSKKAQFEVGAIILLVLSVIGFVVLPNGNANEQVMYIGDSSTRFVYDVSTNCGVPYISADNLETFSSEKEYIDENYVLDLSCS